MIQLSLVTTIAAVLLVTLHFDEALSSGHELEERRSDEPKYSPLWFGPRVGRKKRSDGLYKNVENEDGGVFMDFIKKNPWTVVTFGNGKGHALNLVSKNGGESLEDLSNSEINNLIQRSMTFAPRLGRTTLLQRMARDEIPYQLN
ncbi:unnamed protein product [Acanthoscelides obtectus]|uniref:Uncharacterized protein n=1 Tax=Acanthoscelides obtectus TaxID=200917 RepID=A0A9P0LD52_ACAOB|nr:unnamed protein product [Acanthoscelides obtectus]CAK1673275.1 hypothetical protein AOBTE_LOCUS29285 [Acanthoscelides obtectus]